jgi:hypothetical protein
MAGEVKDGVNNDIQQSDEGDRVIHFVSEAAKSNVLECFDQFNVGELLILCWGIIDTL